MFRSNNSPFASPGIMALAGLIWLGSGRTWGQAAKPADAPTFVAGKWTLIEWLSPDFPRREAVLTIDTNAGKPVVTAIEGDSFHWTAKDVTVVGRHVRMTLTRQEGPLDYQFDGLFDSTEPARVLGSMGCDPENADRATLELNRPDRPAKPAPPSAWRQYLEIESEWAGAINSADASTKDQSPAQRAAARKKEFADSRAIFVPREAKLFGKLIAEQSENPFGFEAAESLFLWIDVLKPTVAEIDSWAKVARTVAARHGPQFESATLGRMADRLIRHAEYAPQARTLAAEADRVAAEIGLPSTRAKRVAEWDEERTAWAAQPNPPSAGSTWAVTISGKVTDAKGVPIPGAEVVVNNLQWATLLSDSEGCKAKTGPDGRYAVALKCQGGENRMHVTGMWAEKRGFVTAGNRDRHKLLPGQSAAVDFTLTPGELFGGLVKIASGGRDETHVLRIKGPGVDELVVVRNGDSFERTLPAGTYAAEIDLGRSKKLTWAGLKSGKTDYLFDQPPFRFTPETVGAGFDEMWNAMERSYSYFILKPDVDWAKLRGEYRPKAIKTKSADELAVVLKEMLGRLHDGHVWIEMPIGEQIGTYGKKWSYNGNRKVVLAQLAETTECGKFAVVGKTKADGFGYFLMTRQSEATPDPVAKAVGAIEKLADVPGFIVDLRTANGGSEPMAQEIARLFCGKQVVYAKSKFRGGKGHDEFTEDYSRDLLPAKSGRPYLKPVVCLIGPGCVSSGEGFAQMMAALPHVTIVGLPTKGSSGNPEAVSIGDTGLRVYFSRWVDMLPDGTPIEDKGVPPAVRIEAPAEAYNDADPTLARGLEILRGKVANGERPR